MFLGLLLFVLFDVDYDLFCEMVCCFVDKVVLLYIDVWEEVEMFLCVFYCEVVDFGLFGIGFFEEYGGMLGDLFFELVMIEELMWVVSGGLFVLLFSYMIGVLFIVVGGLVELKVCVLVVILLGEKISVFVIIEFLGGLDVVNFIICVVCDGDYYIVNGSKIFIIFGMWVDYIIVVVCIGGVGVGGIFVLLVEGDMLGLFCVLFKKMGWWCFDIV